MILFSPSNYYKNKKKKKKRKRKRKGCVLSGNLFIQKKYYTCIKNNWQDD